MTNSYLCRTMLIAVTSVLLTFVAAISVCYGATITPLLSEPTGSQSYNNVSISYTLPENAATGTVYLIFNSTNDANDRALTLNTTTAGAHAFVLTPANLVSNPTFVSSASPSTVLPDDTYDVTLSYSNTMLDPPASASVIGITIDTSTQTPTLNSPADNTVVTSAFSVDYSLPELPLASSPVLSFTPTAGGSSLNLSLNDSLSGPVSWLLDPTDVIDGTYVTGSNFADPLPNNVYDLTLKYQDLLGNPIAMDTVTDITVTTATTTAPVTTTPTTTAPTVSVPETTPPSQPLTLKTKWRKDSKKRTVTALFKTPSKAAKVAITASKKKTVRKGKCKKLSGKKKKFTRCRINLKRGSWLLNINVTDASGNTVAKANKKVTVP